MGKQPAAGEPLRLWPGDAPGALGREPHDTPTLTPYLPEPGASSGAAIVVLPGGGYANLAAHEGPDYALWLNTLGVAAFVVRYRLGSNGYRHPRMLEDAARALRLVRSSASRWGLDAARIGVVGSSAGGHLAATLLTRFDAGDPRAEDPVERVSSRPDLGILCYPVISMGSIGHDGSRLNLLGERPSDEQVQALSNELHVSAETPPCFIWHTWEDASVRVENSLAFAAALRRHGVPFDLHVYQRGAHGLGLGNRETSGPPHPWTSDLAYWLREQGFAR
jgi:acetyl esterase/lipase